MATPAKVCHNCTAKGARRAAFLYSCRGCGRKVCRHYCGNRKEAEGTALCGRCKSANTGTGIATTRPALDDDAGWVEPQRLMCVPCAQDDCGQVSGHEFGIPGSENACIHCGKHRAGTPALV